LPVERLLALRLAGRSARLLARGGLGVREAAARRSLRREPKAARRRAGNPEGDVPVEPGVRDRPAGARRARQAERQAAGEPGVVDLAARAQPSLEAELDVPGEARLGPAAQDHLAARAIH